MTIKEFLDGMNPSTRKEYRTTIKYYKDWRSRKQCFPYFADFLLNIKMAQATRIKHLRQVKYFCKECCLKEKNFGSLHPPLAQPPLSFSDDDFRKLYAAFEHCDYPKFILEGWQRFRYWKTLIHFAVITAIRRKAILSMTWDHINFDELYITVDPEIDKAGQIRYKPITPELAEELRQLRRFYPKGETKVFPWVHGNKIWYRCWKEAESAVGKRFHLHDLKRYSGVLALRAGASPLELQVHMDHASLKTTMKYYCRPQTREMVSRIKLPIEQEDLKEEMPLFTERELEEMVGEIVGRYVRKKRRCIGDSGLEQRTGEKRTRTKGPKKGGKESPIVRKLPGMSEEGGGV